MPMSKLSNVFKSSAAQVAGGAVVVAAGVGTWIMVDPPTPADEPTPTTDTQAGVSGSGDAVAGVSGSGGKVAGVSGTGGKVAGISGTGSPIISAPVANATMAKEFSVTGIIAGISGTGDTVARSVTSVQILVNGQVAQTVQVVDGRWRANVTAPTTGQLIIAAKSYAGKQFLGAATVTVHCCLDNNSSATPLDDLPEEDPFALSIVAPLVGTTVAPGPTMLRGTSAANGTIVILVDQREVATVKASAKGQWQYQLNLKSGEYRVQVRNELNSIAERLVLVE